MTHDPLDRLDQDVARRLSLLADRAPHEPPAPAVDLARGRRHLRRRRAGATGLGVLAAATAVTLAVTLVPGAGDPRGSAGPGPAGQGGTPSTAVDSVSAAPDTVRPLAFGEGLDVVTAGDEAAAASESFASVVAEVLDPEGGHAVLPAENSQSSSGVRGGLTSLGVRVGWRVPGQEGEGQVEVTVRRSADPARATCASAGPSCSALEPPAGAVAARVVRRDDATGVAVARDDGSLVTVATSRLFANNSLVPVSGVDVSEQQLVALAADPRLAVPDVDTGGLLSSFPAEGEPDVVMALGEELLPGPGSTFTLTEGGPDGDGGYSSIYSGPWTGPGGEGRLTWRPDDAPSVAGEATCVEKWFTRCEVRTQDGREVFVGHERGGPGFRVYAIGPGRAVSVSFSGTGFPVDRAVDFVLDPRLQQP
jgi:hypothetical protein